ncbi:MAG: hypothetical protein HC767_06005 [Akkermansiaceae bacterium]|nr:hypothetical protein [Akkermansiaceae bacterium]
MRFTSDLVRGRLIKRYKRFLADVVLGDSDRSKRDDTSVPQVVFVPNTGSMAGLLDRCEHLSVFLTVLCVQPPRDDGALNEPTNNSPQFSPWPYC